MPPQHGSPDQPEPGAQKSRPGVVDSRASSAVDSEHTAAGQDQPSIDPELQAARDEVQANFGRYQRLAADFENYKRRTRQELAHLLLGRREHKERPPIPPPGAGPRIRLFLRRGHPIGPGMLRLDPDLDHFVSHIAGRLVRLRVDGNVTMALDLHVLKPAVFDLVFEDLHVHLRV